MTRLLNRQNATKDASFSVTPCTGCSLAASARVPSEAGSLCCRRHRGVWYQLRRRENQLSVLTGLSAERLTTCPLPDT